MRKVRVVATAKQLSTYQILPGVFLSDFISPESEVEMDYDPHQPTQHYPIYGKRFTLTLKIPSSYFKVI